MRRVMLVLGAFLSIAFGALFFPMPAAAQPPHVIAAAMVPLGFFSLWSSILTFVGGSLFGLVKAPLFGAIATAIYSKFSTWLKPKLGALWLILPNWLHRTIVAAIATIGTVMIGGQQITIPQSLDQVTVGWLTSVLAAVFAFIFYGHDQSSPAKPAAPAAAPTADVIGHALGQLVSILQSGPPAPSAPAASAPAAASAAPAAPAAAPAPAGGLFGGAAMRKLGGV